MRILVLISSDLYVRSFVRSGAFDELAASHELLWVSQEGLTSEPEIADRQGFVGTISIEPERTTTYDLLRVIYMTRHRDRARSMAIRLADMPPLGRLKVGLLSLPGVSSVVRAWARRRLGPNRDLQRVLKETAPDLVIAPTAGTDPAVHDLVDEAAALEIPSLLLFNGWDNLSSKTWFTRLPDFIGVWGDQSVDHAVTIHGFDRTRVCPLGVPTFRQHFELAGTEMASPYPFRYVLFAGCALPFDERTALAALDDALERSHTDDIRIVYRPHPWRLPRVVDDAVQEDEFRHLTIDAQVRAQYLSAIERSRAIGPDEFLPQLDYYPALLSNAELVVCPLSTMVVESAILERPVLVIAYDDGAHPLSPSVVAESDHFEGIDEIDGFEVVHRLEELGPTLTTMLERPRGAVPSLKAQIRHWLYFDDLTYGERLARTVARLPVKPGMTAESRDQGVPMRTSVGSDRAATSPAD